MHINQLKLDCLLLVLGKLSLQTQVQLRLVCSLWKCLLEKNFLTKQSLKIGVNDESNSLLHSYRHTLPQFNQEDTRYFALKPTGLDDDLCVTRKECFDPVIMCSVFYNVKHLVIVMDNNEEYWFNYLPNILSNWPYLTSLSLFGSMDSVSMSYSCKMKDIFRSINSLVELKRLDLCLIFPHISEEWANLFTTLDLSRLQHFSTPSLKKEALGAVPIFPFTKFGSNLTRLTLTTLNKHNFTLGLLKRILLFDNPNLSKNLTHLRLSPLKTGKDFVKFICHHFFKLQCLDLVFNYGYRFLLDLELFTDLTHLAHLNELHLHLINFVPIECISAPSLLSVQFVDLRQVRFVSPPNSLPNSSSIIYWLYARFLLTTFPNSQKFIIHENNIFDSIQGLVQANHRKRFISYNRQEFFQYFEIQDRFPPRLAIDLKNIKQTVGQISESLPNTNRQLIWPFAWILFYLGGFLIIGYIGFNLTIS